MKIQSGANKAQTKNYICIKKFLCPLFLLNIFLATSLCLSFSAFLNPQGDVGKLSNFASLSAESNISNFASLSTESNINNFSSLSAESNINNFASLSTESNINNFASLSAEDNISNFAFLSTESNINNFAFLSTESNINNFASLSTESNINNFASLSTESSLTTSDTLTPFYNDELYYRQWWISSLHLEEAWQQSSLYSSKPVIVAVIDTGIDYTQEDIAGNMWINDQEIKGNKKDDDNNGYVDDYYGWDFYNNDSSVFSYNGSGANKSANNFDNDNHGTHIAGIIAAAANNHLGIAGVAANTNIYIMTLKVFGGVSGDGNTRNIAKAIKYAEAQGATIVNASWNFSEDDPVLRQAIKESNMLFVCSAGNDSENLDKKPSYPCCYEFDNVVSVTSIDETGLFSSSFANYGTNTVELAAPGNHITSTIIGGYRSLYGTSMATPMVTGCAALAVSVNPALSAAQIKNVLLSSTTFQHSLADKTITGGVINAYETAVNASICKPINDSKAPIISTKVTSSLKKVKLKITVKDRGGSKLQLVRYAYGKRKVGYFKKGLKGKTLTSKTLTFKKNRNITIYALDRAGNSSVAFVKCKLKKAK